MCMETKIQTLEQIEATANAATLALIEAIECGCFSEKEAEQIREFRSQVMEIWNWAYDVRIAEKLLGKYRELPARGDEDRRSAIKEIEDLLKVLKENAD